MVGSCQTYVCVWLCKLGYLHTHTKNQRNNGNCQKGLFKMNLSQLIRVKP